MSSPSLTVLISRIGETQPNLAASSVVLIGLLVCVVVVPPWYVLVQPFSTMAHEGAHALALWGVGWPVIDVELQSSGGGGTNFPPGVSFSSDLLVTLVGYLGPSACGLIAAKLISMKHSVAVLWLALVLLGLLLLQVGSFFSVLVVIMAGAVVYLSIRYMPVIRETIMAYIIAWFMLLSGVRTILKRGLDSGDGWDLRDLTGLPRLLWFLFWLAGTGWALVIGAKLLI